MAGDDECSVEMLRMDGSIERRAVGQDKRRCQDTASNRGGRSEIHPMGPNQRTRSCAEHIDHACHDVAVDDGRLSHCHRQAITPDWSFDPPLDHQIFSAFNLSANGDVRSDVGHVAL